MEENQRFRKICVFCGSNSGHKDVFSHEAIELDNELVKRKIDLVYGGGSVGLMGLEWKQITGETAGEVRVVADMHERKAAMAQEAEAFIAFPGGLAVILRCDEFSNLFSTTTKVKCLSDAGFFLDTPDVSGGHTIRDQYNGVVQLQGVRSNLPHMCTDRLNPTSVNSYHFSVVYKLKSLPVMFLGQCFFPQNLISEIKTPLYC